MELIFNINNAYLLFGIRPKVLGSGPKRRGKISMYKNKQKQTNIKVLTLLLSKYFPPGSI